MTIGLPACVNQLDSDGDSRLPPAIKANIDALMEIRDNAAHYIHASSVLARQAEETAAAIESSFLLIESQVATGTVAGVLEGTNGLMVALRGILVGL